MIYDGKIYIEGSFLNVYFIIKKLYVIKVIYRVVCIVYNEVIFRGKIFIFFFEEISGLIGYV